MIQRFFTTVGFTAFITYAIWPFGKVEILLYGELGDKAMLLGFMSLVAVLVWIKARPA